MTPERHAASMAVLTLAAVLTLVGTVLSFGWALPWPVRIALGAVSAALWTAWLAEGTRQRRSGDSGGGAAEAVFAVLILSAVAAAFVTAWIYTWETPQPWHTIGLLCAALLWSLAGIVHSIWLRRDGEPAGRLSPPDAARNRFLILHAPYVIAFVAALVGGRMLSAGEPGAASALAVALPVAVLAVWVWEFARMIRRADEMVKAAQYRAIAVSAGAVLVGAAVWNICEIHLGWPAYPGVFLLPAWAAAYGVALPFQGVET